MSRPFRQGVDYFPVDVHWDSKIKFIKAKFNAEGVGIIVYLYQHIYGQGYWCPWNNDDAFLFADDKGFDFTLLKKLVNECLKREIFEYNLYDKYKILTSCGIQTRYREIVKRRIGVEVINEYLLVDGAFGVQQVTKEAIKCTHDVDIANTESAHDVRKSTQSKVNIKESKYKVNIKESTSTFSKQENDDSLLKDFKEEAFQDPKFKLLYESLQKQNKELTKKLEASEKQKSTVKRKKFIYSRDFEAWWKTYPVIGITGKGSKPKTFEYYKLLDDNEKSTELPASTLNYKNATLTTSSKTRHAERFIRDDYWKEFVETQKPEPYTHPSWPGQSGVEDDIDSVRKPPTESFVEDDIEDDLL